MPADADWPLPNTTLKPRLNRSPLAKAYPLNQGVPNALRPRHTQSPSIKDYPKPLDQGLPKALQSKPFDRRLPKAHHPYQWINTGPALLLTCSSSGERVRMGMGLLPTSRNVENAFCKACVDSVTNTKAGGGGEGCVGQQPDLPWNRQLAFWLREVEVG